MKKELYYVIGQLLRMKSDNQTPDVHELLFESIDGMNEKDLENITNKVKELITYIDNV